MKNFRTIGVVAVSLMLVLSVLDASAFAQGHEKYTLERGDNSATLKRKKRENGSVRKEVLKTKVDGKRGRVVSKFDERSNMISVTGSGRGIDKERRGTVLCAEDPGTCKAAKETNVLFQKRSQGQARIPQAGSLTAPRD